MYLRRIPSNSLGAYLPLTSNCHCPSRDPLVPISASKNVMTCSGCLCILKSNSRTKYLKQCDKNNIISNTKEEQIKKYNISDFFFMHINQKNLSQHFLSTTQNLIILINDQNNLKKNIRNFRNEINHTFCIGP